MKNPRLIDMSGQRYGEWLAIRQAGNTVRGAAVWSCVCSCGKQVDVVGGDLRSGKSLSCGCKGSRTTIGERSATHRMKGTKLHTCWSNMLRRCKDKTNKTYGGKGISVCDEWKTFNVFMSWAVCAGYKDGLTIERINNNLGYFPENCTWATRKQQSRNRSIVKTAADGTTFAEIAELHGVPVGVMNNRVAAGKWSLEKAATTPVGSEKRKLARNAMGQFVSSPSPWRR